MAEDRRFTLEPQLDLDQILREAKTRWLRPSEICEILRNYSRFRLTTDPPYKPSGGSLFLFDRKALRYFRKDGHSWRKKKNGKTVREAHEKLKFGSVDVLHCYYAHGEENENFQRRSYRMLDGQLEHIVLVHYRDVKEGSSSSICLDSNANMMTVDCSLGTQSTSVASLKISPFSTQAPYAFKEATEWNRQAPYSEIEDVDSGEELGETSFADSISYSRAEAASSSGNDADHGNCAGYSGTLAHLYSSGSVDTGISTSSSDGFFASQGPHNLIGGQARFLGVSEAAGGFLSGTQFGEHTAISKWPEFVSTSRKDSDILQVKQNLEKPSSLYDTSRIMGDTISDAHGVLVGEQRKDVQMKVENAGSETDNRGKLMNESSQMYQVHYEHLSQIEPQLENDSTRMHDGSMEQSLENETKSCYGVKNYHGSDSLDNEFGGLKKLDSFGRWMNKEIGKDCDDSLMTSEPCDFWSTINAQTEDKVVPSLCRQMQLDIGSLGPSISQEQLFTILDFSPDWSFSGVETKVLIAGTFLGGIDPRSIKWSCMFGELEVSAEVLETNVLRCDAPVQSPGRVPFYVTCSNRLACSEIREFEYREKVSRYSAEPKKESEEEIYLLVRFAKLLSTGINRTFLICSAENCCMCILKHKISSVLIDNEKEWENFKDIKILKAYNRKPRDALIQKLLKGKLYEWLVCKAHEEGKGPNILDEEGQGVIHLAAALGYDWAMSPIVSAGVSPSFRDARGRTGLHWAAYFGREETVVELVTLGAAPGAVEDPTSKYPHGQTASDIASIRGHKGIAGYLAEAYLTSHLSLLTFRENVMDNLSASLAAEKAIEVVNEENMVNLDGERVDQISLRGSLAAVRKSAQAAARIQAAFRVHSFRQRQLTESKSEDMNDLEDMMVVASLNRFPRTIHFNELLHSSAIKIQQKYRGWKGRREFLKIRDRIVKLQAHVRGHQVRKKYKKIVWSVSIVEKVILRWRRKRPGLRGFQPGRSNTAAEQKVETASADEYDFLRSGRREKAAGVEKALARVQSMARNAESRDQYMRLLARTHKSKLGHEERSFAGVTNSEEKAQEDLTAAMMN